MLTSSSQEAYYRFIRSSFEVHEKFWWNCERLLKKVIRSFQGEKSLIILVPWRKPHPRGTHTRVASWAECQIARLHRRGCTTGASSCTSAWRHHGFCQAPSRWTAKAHDALCRCGHETGRKAGRLQPKVKNLNLFRLSLMQTRNKLEHLFWQLWL